MTKETLNIDIIKPFGPVIAKTNIPLSIIDKLNNYVDDTIKNKDKAIMYDHGSKLAGNVTQEIKIEPEVAKSSGWLAFLAQCTKAYIHKNLGKEIKNFHMIDSWIVRQFKHEYNPVHTHSGHISGAGFIKLPDTLGEQYQTNKGENWNGNLQMVHGSKAFLSTSTYTIEPKLGEFYFFPAYLMHLVYPFRQTDMERRSVSFNAFVDEEVCN